MITLLLTVEDQTQTQLDLLHSRKAYTAVVKNISFLIGVRLRVEQNQLVVVCWRFGSMVIELQGA
jgi:hypothetical protein